MLSQALPPKGDRPQWSGSGRLWIKESYRLRDGVAPGSARVGGPEIQAQNKLDSVPRSRDCGGDLPG